MATADPGDYRTEGVARARSAEPPCAPRAAAAVSNTLGLAPARRAPVHSRVQAMDLRDPAVIAVAALTVFTFVLRFSQIHQSLFGDEVFTYTDVLGKSLRAVLTNVHTGGENSPPLFFLLAYG